MLWTIILFCIAAPTPIALAVMVVLGHAYFVSALGETLRKTPINHRFCLRVFTLCVLIIGSNMLWAWAQWLNSSIPHELMALFFLCYCGYSCINRGQGFSATGARANRLEMCSLIVLFGVCLSAYILLDHPLSNMAHYLFEPAYFYVWFAIHCVCCSQINGLHGSQNHPKSNQETTFGSVAM